MTPVAASSPNADPPVSRIAYARPTRLPGRSRSVSREAGAAPRTSTPATAPFSHSTTVQPVAASRLVQCPTRMPGTSVIELAICLGHKVPRG